MATKAQIEALKRRHGRGLLRTPGVCGVGVERGDEDDYVLVVHLDDDSPELRRKVTHILGPGKPVRLERSGPFRKQ